MGLQDFFRDAKNILLGNTEDYNQPDFKGEIEKAVKLGIITKAEAAELIQTRKNMKLNAKEMDKKQMSSISLEDGTTVSYEDAKAKREELERKKKEKESRQRAATEYARNTDNLKKEINKNKRQVESNKLKIDRNKIKKEMEKDETLDNVTKNIERDGKN